VIAVLVAVQLAVGLPIEEGYVDYTKHLVIRILPQNIQNVETLRNKLIPEFEESVDFWNDPMADLRPVLTLIGPEDNGFLLSLNKSSIKYEVVSSFQKMIDEEREQNSRTPFADTFDFEAKYHTYAEIKAELNSLAAEKSTKVAYKNVGQSYEDREIPSIVITNPGSTTNQTIFFECGIHAREWISTAACLYMADKLLTDPENDKLLDKYEFIIVPTLNVDGYAYTWEHDRNWRMTRSKVPGSTKIGVDPNRNWDSHWCEQGASKTPGSETYCGPKAFSEPEAKHMADLVATRKGRIAAYFSFHSYSELWMYPYGYQTKKPANAARLDELSKIGVNAINKAHGLTFKYGNIYDTIYPASGNSIDWVYDNADAKIVFTLELRDKGTYGFVLPPAQLKPAAEETWAGIRAVIEAL